VTGIVPTREQHLERRKLAQQQRGAGSAQGRNPNGQATPDGQ